jgi:archaetidylinositol phosphate synthase
VRNKRGRVIRLALFEAVPKGQIWDMQTLTQVHFRPARRVHRSLTASVEKRALEWMAARSPRWLTSDQLTALGLAAQFGASAAYALSRYNRIFLVAAVVCIALNWLGDSMDGTLARVRNQQRPRYGFYVDHVIDSYGACFLLGGLALSGFMSAPVAIGLLLAFLMLSIETYLATYTIGTFKLSHFGFGPTELRVLLIAGNVALFYRPWVHVAGHLYRLFDVGGSIGVAGMAGMLVFSSIRHTRLLYQEERLD